MRASGRCFGSVRLQFLFVTPRVSETMRWVCGAAHQACGGSSGLRNTYQSTRHVRICCTQRDKRLPAACGGGRFGWCGEGVVVKWTSVLAKPTEKGHHKGADCVCGGCVRLNRGGANESNAYCVAGDGFFQPMTAGHTLRMPWCHSSTATTSTFVRGTAGERWNPTTRERTEQNQTEVEQNRTEFID